MPKGFYKRKSPKAEAILESIGAQPENPETANISDTPKPFDEQSENPNKGPAKRFSFVLTPDGNIDYDAMRADTKEKLKQILSDPKIKELFGTVDLPELISDQDVMMLYDLIGMLESYAFMFAGKIDADLAQKHGRFDEQQKAMLLGPTKRVLLKHADKFAGALIWKDEVILAMLLMTITRAKFEGARKDQNARNEERRQQNETPDYESVGQVV